MTKTFSSLFLFLFLASCGGGGGSGSGSHVATVTDSDIQSQTAPEAAQTFEVHADMQGFSRNEEDKILNAIELIKKVVASDEFKNRILNYTFNGRKQFYQNNGQTNAQIYKAILEGSEQLTPGNNNAMDIMIRPYFENSIVIGYTMPATGSINLNTKFLDSAGFRLSDVAMNLTHEWMHKLGYTHDFNSTPQRPYSVPYAVGYIMRDLAGRL